MRSSIASALLTLSAGLTLTAAHALPNPNPNPQVGPELAGSVAFSYNDGNQLKDILIELYSSRDGTSGEPEIWGARTIAPADIHAAQIRRGPDRVRCEYQTEVNGASEAWDIEGPMYSLAGRFSISRKDGLVEYREKAYDISVPGDDDDGIPRDVSRIYCVVSDLSDEEEARRLQEKMVKDEEAAERLDRALKTRRRGRITVDFTQLGDGIRGGRGGGDDDIPNFPISSSENLDIEDWAKYFNTERSTDLFRSEERPEDDS